MKIIVVVLLSIIICFSNTSCQKEFALSDVDSSMITPPPGSGVTGTFTAKIDGASFVADKVAAASKSLNVIAIAGQSVAGEQIVLRVADSGVHVYSFDIKSLTNVAAYSKNNDNSFTTNGSDNPSEAGGTMNITEIDTVKKTMSGTFSLKVFRQFDSQQKIITEGVFKNISYATEPLPPANATDTFRVKVDGVAFPVKSISGFDIMGRINISSSNDDVSKTVGFSIPEDVVPGTYDLSLFNMNYIAQYNLGTAYMAAEEGKLIILEHDKTKKRIRANFSFSASELIGSSTADLTEGYFSVVYQ